MQALQPRPVSGEGADPFWEQQHMPDLDNFLQGLLSEPVDLNASLVPAALAVSFGLASGVTAGTLRRRLEQPGQLMLLLQARGGAWRRPWGAASGGRPSPLAAISPFIP